MSPHPTGIPEWNALGALPPIPEEGPDTAATRSPYVAVMSEVVNRFAITADRVTLLDGLLRYRAALYQAGITSGFQWLDGSFVEDVELRQKRAPRDIDTVIFVHLSPAIEQAGPNASGIGTLFDRAYLKTHYLLDAYFFELGKPLDAQTIRYIAYWYGFFHTEKVSTGKASCSAHFARKTIPLRTNC